MLLIENAYKLNKNVDVFDFSKSLKDQALSEIKLKMVELFRNYIFNYKGLDRYSSYKNYLNEEGHDSLAKFKVVNDEISNSYKKQLKVLDNVVFGFNTIIGFWRFKNSTYMKIYVPKVFNGILELTENDNCVEYNFDSENRPKAAKAKKIWEDRGEIWNKIKKDLWFTNLKLNICSTTNMEEFFPFADDVFTDNEINDIMVNGKKELVPF